jgi:hypothetical protein
MQKLLVVILFMLAVNGCVTTGQNKAAQAKLNKFENTIPICDGVADCQAKWEAAQFWVVKYSPLKLQTATNVIIQTYNSPKDSLQLAASVTKEPLGNGRYKILINTWCDNWMFSCNPEKMDAQIHFNNYVGSAKP